MRFVLGNSSRVGRRSLDDRSGWMPHYVVKEREIPKESDCVSR
jgi:hypothetical protein